MDDRLASIDLGSNTFRLSIGRIVHHGDTMQLYAEDKLRDKMFGCMSSRAAQSIADEIADRGPMPMSEVLEAQRAVIQVAKRMADAGDIVIGGGGDEYV